MALLSDRLVEHAATQADAEAIVFESTRLSYGELNERGQSPGERPGCRWACGEATTLRSCSGTATEYMEAYYALSKLGMVAVPLNWRLAEQELTYIVDHSESVALITDEGPRRNGPPDLRTKVDRLDPASSAMRTVAAGAVIRLRGDRRSGHARPSRARRAWTKARC